MAASINFDAYAAGPLPPDWLCGVTGAGQQRWAVEPASDAPSKPNVVKQSAVGDFPWCALKGAVITDGYVDVKFKALSGKRDQAGGVIWRWKDGNNYYVARANALENNVSLYYTAKGKRITLKYVDAPVPLNTWHTLRVEFSGKTIRVILNGKTYIQMEDEHIQGAGAVGLWTKADSVTVFDDFTYSDIPAK
ncbi:MAG: family 16 glycoside hydrolase [Betaproteobacteria bacterium]